MFTKIFFINDFGLLAWLQFLHLEQCQPRQAWILSWSLPLYLHDQHLWGRDSWWVREAPQWNRCLHRELTTAPLASIPMPFWEVTSVTGSAFTEPGQGEEAGRSLNIGLNGNSAFDPLQWTKWPGHTLRWPHLLKQIIA